MRGSVPALLVIVLLAVAACGEAPGAPPEARGSDAATTPAPAARAAPAAPPDVLATAPVGPDGIPVPVQETVDHFAGRQVELKAGANRPGGGPVVLRAYADALDGAEYTFNGRGVFVGFSPGPPGPLPESGDSPLSDEELIAKAREYVLAHFDKRQAAWPAEVARRVEGIDQENEKHYEINVELRERIGDVPGPNFIRLNMGKRGEIESFHRDDGPVAVESTTPRVSRERALALAAAAADYEKAKAAKQELVVQRDPLGGTRLVWDLEIDDATPAPPDVVRIGGDHAWVVIDALTGEVVRAMSSR